MIGADFETVAGPWVVRGEVAAFPRDVFQAPDQPLAIPGRSFDAGAALDRKAGEYRLSGQVVVHREERKACEPGSLCASPVTRRRLKLVLWIATGIAVPLVTFPWWSAFILG